jgi:hypothetical protein
MTYYANFTEVDNERFRLDTRIYLEETPETPNIESGVCIAAVVGKNPGSARPRRLDEWALLDLGNDKMLPNVRNRFRSGYELAGKTIPHGAFVRVWNLFYLCNADLDAAVESINRVGSKAPTCASEASRHQIVWFIWGSFDARINRFKARFQKANIGRPFFFDNLSKAIIERVPAESEFARHTQGMRVRAIDEYLASIL